MCRAQAKQIRASYKKEKQKPKQKKKHKWKQRALERTNGKPELTGCIAAPPVNWPRDTHQEKHIALATPVARQEVHGDKLQHTRRRLLCKVFFSG